MDGAANEFWSRFPPKFRPTLNETERIVAHASLEIRRTVSNIRNGYINGDASGGEKETGRDETSRRADSIRFVNDRPMPSTKL